VSLIMLRCFDVEKLKLTDFMIIHAARPTPATPRPNRAS
jgi:hypothetical protein